VSQPMGDGEPSPDVKLCECGCGEPAPLARKTSEKHGCVKGQPLRFVKGHALGRRRRPHVSVQVGQRFGRGVVIDPDVRIPAPGERGRKGGTSAAVRLRCDDGNIYVVRRDRLLAGRCKSCGCGRGRPGCRSDPARAAQNLILGAYKSNAKKRGLAWELTDEEFFRLISLPCFYCGQPPTLVRKVPQRIRRETRRDYYDSGFAANGLDRVHNELPYTSQNVVPCCEQCNRAKLDQPLDAFMAWVARLTEYQWFHPDSMPSAMLRAAAISRPPLAVVPDTA
jgi:5-methylcytosine-specific restriction endonuclease McrA